MIFPKFAYCKFSRFNYAMFRSSLYNIVPSNQRKEGHIAVVRKVRTFLRECDTCSQNKKIIARKYTGKSVSDLSEFPYEDHSPYESYSRIQSSVRKKTEKNQFSFWETVQEQKKKETPVMLDRTILWNELKQVVMAELNKDEGTTYDISPFMFSFPRVMECTCYELSIGVYEELIYQSEQAGLTHVLLKFLIEYAEQTLRVGKYEDGVLILLGAESAYSRCKAELKSKKKDKDTFNPLAEVKVSVDKEELKFAFNKICVNLATANFYLGQTEEAAKLLKRTDRKIPPALLYTLLLLITGRGKPQLKAILALRCEIYNRLSELNMSICEINKAVKLSYISTIYSSWLNDLRLQSVAYANYLDLAIISGRMHCTKKLEKVAISRCVKCYKGNDIGELISMGHLFSAVFKSRYFRGKFSRAASTGLAALQFTQHLGALEAQLYLTPMVVHCFIRLLRFEEIKLIMWPLIYNEGNLMTYIKQLDLYLSDLYHLTNIELFLETGVSSSNVMSSVKALKLVGMLDDFTPTFPVSRKLAINVWLLYLRQGNYKQAMEFEVPEFLSLDMAHDNFIKTLRMLEARLLKLSYNLNRNRDVTKLYTEIYIKFYCLERRFLTKLPIHYPRYLMYKAYYKIMFFDLTYNRRKKLPGRKHLAKAYRIASKLGNKLDMLLIQKNVEYWFNRKPEAGTKEKPFVELKLTDVISQHLEGKTFEELIKENLPVLPLPEYVYDKISDVKEREKLFHQYSKIFN